jgi:hypothetical protein
MWFEELTCNLKRKFSEEDRNDFILYDDDDLEIELLKSLLSDNLPRTFSQTSLQSIDSGDIKSSLSATNFENFDDSTTTEYFEEPTTGNYEDSVIASSESFEDSTTATITSEISDEFINTSRYSTHFGSSFSKRIRKKQIREPQNEKIALVQKAFLLLYSAFNSGNKILLHDVIDTMCSKSCEFTFTKCETFGPVTITRSGVQYGKHFYDTFSEFFPGSASIAYINLNEYSHQ